MLVPAQLAARAFAVAGSGPPVCALEMDDCPEERIDAPGNGIHIPRLEQGKGCAWPSGSGERIGRDEELHLAGCAGAERRSTAQQRAHPHGAIMHARLNTWALGPRA